MSEHPHIPVTHLRLQIQMGGATRLNEWSGSAWRGLMGHVLKDTVCVTRAIDCRLCLLRGRCPHAQIFETPIPEGTTHMRKYTAAPHPYVLRPPAGPRELRPGDFLQVQLLLFGQAARYAGLLVQVFQRMGQRGLTRRRTPFTLYSVEHETPPGGGQWERFDPADLAEDPVSPPPAPHTCTVHLETPLRVKRDGRLVRPETFVFHDLFRALLRRAALLSRFHTTQAWEPDFRALLQAAQAVPITEARLHWREWTRYSARQRSTMQMGGLTGSFRLPERLPEPLWQLLWLGQWLHAGKATVMGFGQYRLEAPLSV